MTRVTNKVPVREASVNAERVRLRRHPIFTDSAKDIDIWIDSNVKTMPDVIAALKVVAKLAALKP